MANTFKEKQKVHFSFELLIIKIKCSQPIEHKETA